MSEMIEFGRWVYWAAIVVTVISVLLPQKWGGKNPVETTRALATIGLTLMIVGFIATLVGA